ncbi:hypothetical protein AAC387_Pa02g0656 [Persea americana]
MSAMPIRRKPPINHQCLPLSVRNSNKKKATRDFSCDLDNLNIESSKFSGNLSAGQCQDDEMDVPADAMSGLRILQVYFINVKLFSYSSKFSGNLSAGQCQDDEIDVPADAMSGFLQSFYKLGFPLYLVHIRVFPFSSGTPFPKIVHVEVFFPQIHGDFCVPSSDLPFGFKGKEFGVKIEKTCETEMVV